MQFTGLGRTGLSVSRLCLVTTTFAIMDVALAWLLAQPVITSPIIGARTVAQLTELVGAVNLVLADNEIARLNEVTRSF